MFTQKELDLQQLRWLVVLKDYDMSVPYNAHMVTDTRSRMTMGTVSHIEEKDLVNDVHRLLIWVLD